jgi:hypothetical protein
MKIATKNSNVKHFFVGSRTGDGMEELKTSLIDLVTKDYARYCRVEVPEWYVKVESKIRGESLKGRFTLDQNEFLHLLFSLATRR